MFSRMPSLIDLSSMFPSHDVLSALGWAASCPAHDLRQAVDAALQLPATACLEQPPLAASRAVLLRALAIEQFLGGGTEVNEQRRPARRPTSPALRGHVAYLVLASRACGALDPAAPPTWAIAVLGEPPPVTRPDLEWSYWRTCLHVAAVRGAYGIEDPDPPLGSALRPPDPHRYAYRDRRWAWSALAATSAELPASAPVFRPCPQLPG